MSADASLTQRPEIRVMIMNLYECLGVEVSPNAAVARGEWIYLGRGFVDVSELVWVDNRIRVGD